MIPKAVNISEVKLQHRPLEILCPTLYDSIVLHLTRLSRHSKSQPVEAAWQRTRDNFGITEALFTGNIARWRNKYSD